MQIVNPTDQSADTRIEIAGFVPKKPTMEVTELAAPLARANTAADSQRVRAIKRSVEQRLTNGKTRLSIPPYAVVVMLMD